MKRAYWQSLSSLGLTDDELVLSLPLMQELWAHVMGGQMVIGEAVDTLTKLQEQASETHGMMNMDKG
jgi:hypothetical protein